MVSACNAKRTGGRLERHRKMVCDSNETGTVMPSKLILDEKKAKEWGWMHAAGKAYLERGGLTKSHRSKAEKLVKLEMRTLHAQQLRKIQGKVFHSSSRDHEGSLRVKLCGDEIVLFNHGGEIAAVIAGSNRELTDRHGIAVHEIEMCTVDDAVEQIGRALLLDAVPTHMRDFDRRMPTSDSP